MRGEKETDGNFNVPNTYPRFTDVIKCVTKGNRDCKTPSKIQSNFRDVKILKICWL